MDSLVKIFGNIHRVKLMRFFLFHPKDSFSFSEIYAHARIKKEDLRKELKLLVKASFLKEKKQKKGKRTENRWSLKQNFPFIQGFADILIHQNLLDKKSFLKSLRKFADLKLVVLSGFFVKDEDREIDLLIVGKSMKREKLIQYIEQLESEIGKEIRYTLFSVDEFMYRLEMHDKLIRDIFDHKKEVLLAKIEII